MECPLKEETTSSIKIAPLVVLSCVKCKKSTMVAKAAFWSLFATSVASGGCVAMALPQQNC